MPITPATIDTDGLAFQFDTEHAVLFENPECADYTNPRGAVYGTAVYLAAFNAYGDRVRLYLGTVDRHDTKLAALAQRTVAALQARFDRLGKLPVAFHRWEPARPVYGSQAYVDYGQADDLAQEARELADEAWN